MIRFILKLAICALIAAVGSFWASERITSKQITVQIAETVVPITLISDLIHAAEKNDMSILW